MLYNNTQYTYNLVYVDWIVVFRCCFCYGQNVRKRLQSQTKKTMCILFIWLIGWLVGFLFVFIMMMSAWCSEQKIILSTIMFYTYVFMFTLVFNRDTHAIHTHTHALDSNYSECFIIWWQCVATFYSRCKIRTRLTLIDVLESLNKNLFDLFRNYPWNFNWWRLLFGSSIWKFSMKFNYSRCFFFAVLFCSVLFNFIQLFLDDKLYCWFIESLECRTSNLNCDSFD